MAREPLRLNAQGQLDKMTIDDLVASATAGKGSLENGRTLTTLVKTDGQWLADTVWFE